jgi:hypothetical protein
MQGLPPGIGRHAEMRKEADQRTTGGMPSTSNDLLAASSQLDMLC